MRWLEEEELAVQWSNEREGSLKGSSEKDRQVGREGEPGESMSSVREAVHRFPPTNYQFPALPLFSLFRPGVRRATALGFSVDLRMIEEVMEKIHDLKDSSSGSDNEEFSLCDANKKCFFGNKAPVHAILGGGKYADILLWRDMKTSGSIFAGVTVFWLLFEWIGYHLITFICHSLIVSLAVIFIWSNAASFISKPPPKLPDVILPEALFLSVAHCLRFKINEAFATFHSIASGNDLKKFLMVIAGLWFLSVVGSWFSFLTFFYIAFVFMYFAPMFYETYEDQVDSAVEKAMAEIRKQHAVLDEKVLQKIPGCPFSTKKHH